MGNEESGFAPEDPTNMEDEDQSTKKSEFSEVRAEKPVKNEFTSNNQNQHTSTNRQRRPSHRAKAMKREFSGQDLSMLHRAQSSIDVLPRNISNNVSGAAPPPPRFPGLKRTKSDNGADPQSSFNHLSMSASDHLDDMIGNHFGSGNFSEYSNKDAGDAQVNKLAARLGSRRVSITSVDDDASEISKIVAQTAFPASTLQPLSVQRNAEVSNSNSHSSNARRSISTAMKKLTKQSQNKSLSTVQEKKVLPSESKEKLDAPKKSGTAICSVTRKLGAIKSAIKKDLDTEGWTQEEDQQLKDAVTEYGTSNWTKICEKVPTKTQSQLLYRWNKILRPGFRKGTWTPEEDAKLMQYVMHSPKKNWGEIASLISGRSAKQCRERWCYNLDPTINKEAWSPDEDRILMKAQGEMGNRWAHIASLLPGRTENAVKTRYKSIMRAKKREWLPEEDKLILKMHQEIGSRWDTIAEKLPNRTKNAVKTRFRMLGKGITTKITAVGAPNQTLQREPVDINVKPNVSLAELTQKIASAHKALKDVSTPSPKAQKNSAGNFKANPKKLGVSSVTTQKPGNVSGIKNPRRNRVRGAFDHKQGHHGYHKSSPNRTMVQHPSRIMPDNHQISLPGSNPAEDFSYDENFGLATYVPPAGAQYYENHAGNYYAGTADELLANLAVPNGNLKQVDVFADPEELQGEDEGLEFLNMLA